MQIGIRIYYEISTGNPIQKTEERQGTVVETTYAQDSESYYPLFGRDPSTVGVIQLSFGQYAQDFAECNGYKVDISGAEPTLVFSYPIPGEPEAPPVYQPPLSEEVAALKVDNAHLTTRLTKAEADSADTTSALLDLYELVFPPA
jgi:hypothetical protein